MQTNSARVDLLDRRHPQYEKHREAWRDIELLYAGGNAIRREATRFLQPRPSEPADLWNSRLSRFTYTNVLGTCVGWYGSKLFREDPTISLRLPDGQEAAPMPGGFYTEFQRNCDRAGTSLVNLFRRVFQDLVLYQQAWILTDTTKAPAAATLAEQLAAGVDKPYLVHYSPQQVINWDTDEAGNLEWVVIACQQSRGGFLEPAERIDRWYYFNKTEYRVYERALKANTPQQADTAELVDWGLHALAAEKRVPVRRFSVPDGMWLANRAYLPVLDHLNAENSLSWALMIANLAMPIIFSERDVKPSYSEVGYIQLDPGDSFQWSEHPGNSFIRQAERISYLREEIYRGLYLMAQGRDSGAVSASQSGYAKALDLQPAYDLLDGFGDTLRPAMEQVLQDISAARGEGDYRWNIRGFQFEQRLSMEEVQILQSVLGMDIGSQTLRKELFKKTAQAALPDASPELRGVIDREIETASAEIAI